MWNRPNRQERRNAENSDHILLKAIRWARIGGTGFVVEFAAWFFPVYGDVDYTVQCMEMSITPSHAVLHRSEPAP